MLLASISQSAGLSWLSTSLMRVLSQTELANSRLTSSRSASDWWATVNWRLASRSWLMESTKVRSAKRPNSSTTTLNGRWLRVDRKTWRRLPSCWMSIRKTLPSDGAWILKRLEGSWT